MVLAHRLRDREDLDPRFVAKELLALARLDLVAREPRRVGDEHLVEALLGGVGHQAVGVSAPVGLAPARLEVAALLAMSRPFSAASLQIASRWAPGEKPSSGSSVDSRIYVTALSVVGCSALYRKSLSAAQPPVGEPLREVGRAVGLARSCAHGRAPLLTCRRPSTRSDLDRRRKPFSLAFRGLSAARSMPSSASRRQLSDIGRRADGVRLLSDRRCSRGRHRLCR